MDDTGVGAEKYSERMPFQGKREAPAPGTGAGPGGGVTTATSSVGPPEMLLNEIAESLRDTTRKPSFAKIQSVQVCEVATIFWGGLPRDYLLGQPENVFLRYPSRISWTQRS